MSSGLKLIAVVFAVVGVLDKTAVVNGSQFTGDYSKLSGIIIPDHAECKSRPDSGLSAITELDPGYITGAPLLGSVQTVEATLSGFTFGLPVPEGTARLMFNSFGSSLWMTPFSEYCTSENVYSKHFSSGRRKKHNVYHCDDLEYRFNYSGFPTNIINIEIPSVVEAYPSFEDEMQANLSKVGCGVPTQLSFSAREIADGTFFKAIEDYDPDSKRLLYQLDKLYHGDPVMNPLTPWERPPLKNIFCIYGVDSRTEVGYYFAPSGKPYPDNWIMTDVVYEFEGSLYTRSGNLIEGNPGAASGDETVPYNSLSYCKNWLGPKVNITRTPQSEHEGEDVQVHLDVEHHPGADIIPNMTRSPRVKYITYYEDSESLPGQRTAVWELDKANHRNIVRSPILMRELWLEMWHDIHPDKKSKFVTKGKRGPLRDEDCYWDYGKARCAWPEYCEYRYVFGDVHLGQSCRVRSSSADLLLSYV
ncbi:hypothetical protein M8C21_001456 [Ambrosia artemisiifolia]|uniref:Phospholipid--sterol O-acyltransferase n=1 Tax=Ambrosia artemisiifolia TaxID=4212 RepID=A0AAD5G7H7_AMBAR|nr:hypothetical protein M8C21_001456 [Ambrosia artemisiifolia]